MPIQFKSLLSSAVANDTFLDKTIDDIKVGKLGLYKASPSEATAIEDIQAYIAQLAESSGVNGENDANRVIYSSTVYISNGDDRKAAIGKLDAQLSANATLITNLQNDFNLGPIRFREYISESAFETANGTPTGGEAFYDSTEGFPKYFDGVTAQWKPIGAAPNSIQGLLGTGDGLNDTFNLAAEPVSGDAVHLYTNGVRIEDSEYSISGQVITFNSPPAAGQRIYVDYLSGTASGGGGGGGGNRVVEYRTLTAADFVDNEFTLSFTPVTASEVVVDLIGGTAQESGVDFTVTSNVFSFDGLGLDGLIASGDKLRIDYFA